MTTGVGRIRLDVALVERGLADTRARAQGLIRAGEVSVDGQTVDKPATAVRADARVTVREPFPFVGRGALKLVAALAAFAVDPDSLTCLDVGASTGGFTDALLQRGARIVYSVDVGRGQLAWKLRGHPRVVNLERTDIRSVKHLPDSIDLATIDVSFISLRRVLPAVSELLAEDGVVIVLIKPQFEAARRQVGHGGVVREPGVHLSVLRGFLGWCDQEQWRIAGVIASPLTGARGNREFLALLSGPGSVRPSFDVAAAIDRAVHGD